jgi:mannosylfructose-phosphate synthase
MAEQGSILMISTHGYVAADPEFGKPDTGGQVVFVLELARRFARLGYRVDVVTRQFEDQPEEEPIDQRLRIWRIPFGGRQFIPKEDMHDHIEQFATNFLQAVEREGLTYDIVHSHYWDAGWGGMRIAEALNIPHVHTPHSLGWWKRQQMLDAQHEAASLEKTYRFTERIEKEKTIYDKSDYLVPTTDPQQELLNREYRVPREKMTVIPPGIDDERYTPSFSRTVTRIRQRLNFTERDIYTVGRAAENKGIDLLIHAFSYVRRLVPEARLKLAMGGNSEKDQKLICQWQQLAKDVGVSSHVDWLGYIPNDKMSDYYRAAGVFALPSRYEPFGMTAIEAMACGTPTVVTVHGGLCERLQFGEHALYAAPQQPQEFGTMLAMPIRYPKLHWRLASSGAELARQQFGWTGLAKRTLSLFHRLADIGTGEPDQPRNDSLRA